MQARTQPHERTRAPNAEPIPGYRLIEPLGSGGFGEVWKCEAPGGLFKAIKFVHGGGDGLLGNDVSGAEQELRALQHVKSLRHPFLLSMDRVEIVAGELVIVMELADKSLHDVLTECQAAGRPGLPRADLLLYLREAAEVLDLLNLEYGLQHLDIKPRNLFLVSGHVKVADFGLVNSLANLNDPGAAAELGAITPIYASPECFQGKISLFSDQYSLAVVYCELLTGSLPFPGKNFRQLMLLHTTGEPDLALLPEGDRPLVGRALAKEPRERFPSSLEFVRALIARESEAPAGETSAAHTKAATIHDICLVEKARTAAIARPTRAMPRPANGNLRGTSSTGLGHTADEGGVSLDDYHFLDCLGRSPLGEMWKTETPEGEVRLVKLVNTFSQMGLFGEDDPVERLRAVRHSGLLPCDVAPHPPNRLALITPLTPDSLASRLQNCRDRGMVGIPRDELLEHLHSAAETLDAIYRTYRVQHFGLNPRNLVLLEDQLRIADFGLMALVWMPAGQEAGQINPRYSAPELFGKNNSTAPLCNCDQYGLGLIYHELLTGTHLFGNMTQRQLGLARSSGRLSLDLVPAPDRPALMRALHPDANQRFRSCTDFVRALQAVGAPAPLSDPDSDLGIANRPPSKSGEDGWVLLGTARSSGSHVPVQPERPVLSEVLLPGTQEAIAALVARIAGKSEVREFRSARYLLKQGESIEHTCYARLVPGTLRLKMAGFREQWQAELLNENGDDFLFRVRLQSSFWQRCLGRQPGLEVRIQAQPSRSPHAVLTNVLIRIVPVSCGQEEGAAGLEKYGPLLIDSLRTQLQAGPERRAQPRLPFDQPVQACAVGSDKRLGEPFLCQGKDISLGGLGLYLPCKPPLNYLILQLQDSPRGAPLSVAAQVVRAQPCGDGRYEVGLRFVQN